MKPKSQSRFLSNRNTHGLTLAATISLFALGNLGAVTWSWDGGAGTGNWTDGNNWNPNIATAYPTGFPQYNQAPTVMGDRISVNSAQAFDYTAAQGHTIFGGNTIRGLVIGSGSNGTMNLTGGIFSSQGNTIAGPGAPSNTCDVVGNGNGTTAVFNINGGSYISGAGGLALGLGGSQNASPSTSTLNITNGSATVTTLPLNNNTTTININSGGTLAANSVTYVGWAAFLNIDGGTLKARTSNTAFVPDGANLTARVKAGGATIDTDAFNVTISEPLLEDPLSTGGGLTKNGTGTLTLANPSTITGAVTVNGGGLGMKAGATSWQPSSFTHSGSILNFDLGVYNPSNPPVLDVADLTLNTAGITVNISGASIPVSSEIKILDYGTKSGTGTLTLNVASLPVNMVATLQENLIDGYYYLNVTSPSATAFAWSGDSNADGTGTWDTIAMNWNTNSLAYAEPAIVTFPNITAGGIVDIPASVAPLAVSIDNATTNNYLFSGTGKISGATGITKSGTGTASFDVAANDYSGTLAINGGALIKKVADATSGGITVAADDVSFVLDGGITDGAGQTLTISGRGAVNPNYFFVGSAVQRGALQAHNGASTWQGNITLASNSTATINRIGVQNGASLTLTGNITESVTAAPLLFRAGLSGDDITLNGTGTYGYTGQTQIFSNGGSIILGADNKLPTVSSVFFGSSGSTVLDLNGNDQEFAGLTGNAFNGTAIITNNGATPSTLTTTNPAELPTEIAEYFPTNIVDGSSIVSFIKNGAGTQIVAGFNSYTGTTVVNGGRLEIQENQTSSGDVTINAGSIKLSNGRSLLSGVNLTIANGAFFYPDGSSQTLGKLEGSGTVDFTYTATGLDTLTVGSGDLSSQFDGLIQQSTVRQHALKKIGTGTFTLTGANTYTGNTTVEDGTLSVAQPAFPDASSLTIGLAESSPAVLHLPNPGTDIVAELIIDGVSQPGAGLVYDSLNSGGAITGSGKIQVGVAPVTGYAAWAIANNVVGSENEDDDKDGISNLVEYALGLNPQLGNPAPGTFVGNLLTFTKGTEAKAADDVTYTIETSTTLEAGSWTPAAATDTEDDISFALPTGVGGKNFGRLKVVKP